jgi:hypothetical protein
MNQTTPREPALSLDDAELDALLRRLNLATIRRTYRSAVTRAEQGEWSYRDFLGLLVADVTDAARIGLSEREVLRPPRVAGVTG